MADYGVPPNPPYETTNKKRETGRIPSLFFPAPAGAGYVITWLALPVPLVPLEPLAPPLPAWLLFQS